MSSDLDSNPLLRFEFEIPFNQIKAEQIEPAIDELLGDAQDRLDRLAADPENRTFENTLLALEAITERLEHSMGIVGHLESVATYPELRAAYNAVQPRVSEFYSSIPLHENLWRQLKSYAETSAAARLGQTRARFLKKTLDSFRRNGAELDAAGKARLTEINVELTKLTTQFSENVLDATNAFELLIEDESKLAGLPPSAVEAARQSGEEKGVKTWRFTLKEPSYIALMTYLDNAATREQVYRAFSTRASGGPFDNRQVIAKVLALRREKSQLLGYDNFADLVLEERMAKRGASARDFVRSLTKRTRAAFQEETDELQDFRRALEGKDVPGLQVWDLGYYAEKLRKTEYEFDEEELRPYFPFESVLEGLFDLTGQLYGITVKQRSGVPVWEPAVTYYSVHDEDGAWLGAFYADFFPRENKRGGAWMDSLITGTARKDDFRPHLGVICGNLTPPVGEKQALLTHREVETLFHEFGHLLHHLLSRVEIRSLAGTNVPWDFVELPSQIMENWCWEREALDLFARHYQSGETIPEELFQKLKRTRNFRAAGAQMRQLSFSTLDLGLHIDYSLESDGDVMSYAFDLLQSFSPVKLPSDHAMIAGFSHLFADPVGYGAGYYSYKWSEVLEADAFTRFAKDGIFSPKVGREFREQILSKGDSEDPAKLFRGFMGRDPDSEALLRRLGLADKT